MNLHDVFTSTEAQRVLIARGAAALHAIGQHATGGALFGDSSAQKKAVRGQSPVTGAVLLRPPAAVSERVGQIAGYYQQLAVVERSEPVLLYAALCMLVLLPRAAEAVCAATPSNLAPFFHGNDVHGDLRRRFELYLTGTADRNAILPLQMIVAERQLLLRFS